ncbi:hypothetical protein DFP72DRAFT_851540 [Ephemerocybe angulata]|uniref:Uncharacterized protein n=1 Tax=Ephemerocybe angulata TaxID=980116 RepID=A0A8H6M2F0_9AGAR|nr:hypothetical protein DFP72DRAFT_851540 [Tulosesus angulatus]
MTDDYVHPPGDRSGTPRLQQRSTPDKLRGLKGLYRAEILRLREAGVKEVLGLPDMKKMTKATPGAATMRTQSLGWSEDGTTNSTSYRGLHTLYLVSTLGGQTGALHNPPASKANVAAKPPSRTSSRRSEEGEVKEEEEAEDEAAPADPNANPSTSSNAPSTITTAHKPPCHLKEFLGEEYEAARIAWCTGAPPPAPKEPPSKAKATTVKEEAVKVEETVEETRSFDKHRWSMLASVISGRGLGEVRRSIWAVQKKSNGRWPSTCTGPFGTTQSDNPTRQAPPSIGYVRALNVRLQQRSTMSHVSVSGTLLRARHVVGRIPGIEFRFWQSTLAGRRNKFRFSDAHNEGHTGS